MRDATRGGSRWRRAEARLESLAAKAERIPLRVRAYARPLPRFLVLLFAATAAWILLWAWYDVRILGQAFPSAPGYHPDLDVYWISTWWVLFPATTILIFRRHAWLPILALGLAGWEDVLFYWIQAQPVPSSLAYLPQTPTAEALYVRAAAFLLAAVAGAIVARLPSMRVRFVPPELVMPAAGFLGSFWIFIASIPAYVAVRWLATRLARRGGAAVPRDH